MTAATPRPRRVRSRIWLGRQRILAHAAVLALRVEWSLRHRPLDELCEALGVTLGGDLGDPGRRPTTIAALPHAHRLRLWATDRTLARLPYVEASCLRRSLVFGGLVRDVGPVLHLGVRREHGVVAAHAWLETPDAVLSTDDRTYRPLVSRPRAHDTMRPGRSDETGSPGA